MISYFVLKVIIKIDFKLVKKVFFIKVGLYVEYGAKCILKSKTTFTKGTLSTSLKP